MAKYFISAVGTSNNHTVNCREEPNLKSNIVRRISSNGEVVEYLSTTSTDFYVWTQYRDSANRVFWVRNDVHRFALMDTYKKLNVPYVSQKDAVEANLSGNDCGAASLLMLMKYYRTEVNLTVNDLTRQMGIKTDFASFNDLNNAAKRHGFNPKFKRPFLMPDIINSINENHPVLVLVDYDELFIGRNYGHFIVVVGYDTDNVFVHDPYEQRDMSYQHGKFLKAYSQMYTTYNLPYQSLIFDNNVVRLETVDALISEIERLFTILKREMGVV